MRPCVLNEAKKPMATVTSADGTTLVYDRIGAGPAVILVDAAGGFRAFGPMPGLAALLAANFTVITYDRRGRGESTDTQPYAVEREVEDIAALIDAVGSEVCLHGFSSGAILCLQAAAHGLPVKKLSLLEPPLETDDPNPPESPLAGEIAGLIAQGRRDDALAAFNRGIGVPDEMVANFRQSPQWATMTSVAHTLVYDLTVTPSLKAAQLASITTPTLVLDSTGSGERLRHWAEGVANHLPNATYRSLQGGWHGVPLEDLAAAMTEFFQS
jgi:pimeloyl-ACP methyl ester carboxylesterase